MALVSTFLRFLMTCLRMSRLLAVLCWCKRKAELWKRNCLKSFCFVHINSVCLLIGIGSALFGKLERWLAGLYRHITGRCTRRNLMLCCSIICVAFVFRKRLWPWKGVSGGRKQKKSPATTRRRPNGIPNIGNTCFMNALIQVLCVTPNFRKQLKRATEQTTDYSLISRVLNATQSPALPALVKWPLHPLFKLFNVPSRPLDHILLALVDAVQYESDVPSTLPQALIDCLCQIDKRFEGKKQQDSYEFYNKVIGELEDLSEGTSQISVTGTDTEQLMKKSPISLLFGGQFCTIYRYSTCEHVELVFQRFTSIPVQNLPKPQVHTHQPPVRYENDGDKYHLHTQQAKDEAAIQTHIKPEEQKIDNQLQISLEEQETDTKARMSLEGEKTDNQTKMHSEQQNTDNQTRMSLEGERTDNQTKMSSEGERTDNQTGMTSEGERTDNQTGMTSKGERNDNQTGMTSEGERNDNQTGMTSEGEKTDNKTRMSSEGDGTDNQTGMTSEGEKTDNQTRMISEGGKTDNKTRMSSEGDGTDNQTGMTSEGERTDNQTGMTSEGERTDNQTGMTSEGERTDNQTGMTSEGEKTDNQTKLSSEAERTDNQTKMSSEAERTDNQTRMISEAENTDNQTRMSSEGERTDNQTGMTSEGERTDNQTGMTSEGERTDNQTGMTSEGEKTDNQTGMISGEKTDNQTGMISEGDKTDNQTKMSSEAERTDNQTKMITEGEKTDNQTRMISEGDKTDNQTKMSSESQRTDNQTKMSSDAERTDIQTKMSSEAERTDSQTRMISEGKNTDNQTGMSSEGEKTDNQTGMISEGEKIDNQTKMSPEEQKTDNQTRMSLGQQKTDIQSSMPPQTKENDTVQGSSTQKHGNHQQQGFDDMDSRPHSILKHTPHGTTDLERGLTLWTDVNRIDALSCKTCGSKDPGICTSSRILCLALPPVLVLQFNRFQNFDGILTKLNRKLSFPEFLDAAPFCSSAMTFLNNHSGAATEPDTLYRLYGVVCHVGSIHRGHYTAHVRTTGHREEEMEKRFLSNEWRDPERYVDEILKYWKEMEPDNEFDKQPLPDQESTSETKDKWCTFDDTRVVHVECTLENVLSEGNAYILMYERVCK